MLKLRDTFYMGQALSAPAKLKQGQAYEDGKKCAAVYLKTTIPIKNLDNAAGHAPTAADVADFMACIFNKNSLAFGLKERMDVDVNNAFTDSRDLEKEQSLRDYLVKTSSGWVELDSLSGTSAVGASIVALGSGTVIVMFKRSFELPTLAAADRYSRCPGAEQMRQIIVEVNPGGQFNPTNSTFGINGQVQIDYMTEDVDAEDHEATEWVTPLRLVRTDVAGRDQPGPEGALFAVWENSANGASCAIDMFSITRKGEEALIRDGHVADVVATQPLRDPLGMESANAGNVTKTLFYKHPVPSSLSELPTSTGWAFHQPGNEIATPHMRWAVFTPQNDLFLEKIAANITDDKQQEARLVNSDAYHGRKVSASVTSTAGVAIMRPGASKYSTLPATPLLNGKVLAPVIPEHTQTAAEARVKASAPAAKAGAAANVAESLGRYVPGTLAPSKTAAVTTAKAKLSGLGAVGNSIAEAFKRIF